MTVPTDEDQRRTGGRPTSACADQLLPLLDVMRIVGLSRPTIYRAISHGRFPRPVKFGSASRWSAQEIADYVERLKAARAHKAPQP